MRNSLNIKDTLIYSGAILLKFLLWFLLALFFLYNSTYEHFRELPGLVPENFYNTSFVTYKFLVRFFQQKVPGGLHLLLVLQNLFSVLSLLFFYSKTSSSQKFSYLLLFFPLIWISDVSLLPFSFFHSFLFFSITFFGIYLEKSKIKWLLFATLSLSVMFFLLPVYLPILVFFLVPLLHKPKIYLLSGLLPLFSGIIVLFFPVENTTTEKGKFSQYFSAEQKQLQQLYTLLGKSEKASLKKFGEGQFVYTLPKGLSDPKEIREKIHLLQGFALCLADEGKNICRREFRERITKIISILEKYTPSSSITRSFFPQFIVKLPSYFSVLLLLSFIFPVLLFFFRDFRKPRNSFTGSAWRYFSFFLLFAGVILLARWKYSRVYVEVLFPLSVFCLLIQEKYKSK